VGVRAFQPRRRRGDNAGGNLPAAAALRARDSGLRLALQLLIYPVLDYAVENAFYYDFAEKCAEFAGLEGFGKQRHAETRHIREVMYPTPCSASSRTPRPCGPYP
jgi:acetyl esterase/lipase